MRDQAHHIVIFDKSSLEVERLVQLLRDNSFDVTVLSNAQDAYQFCLVSQPDLIVFDIKVAGKEGLNFYRQIKNQYSTQRIPLILTTEEADHNKRVELIEMGIDDFVAKPYYAEEVVARIINLFQEFRPATFISKSVERGFIGSLKEMTLIDLIQTMELGKKSGVINLNRGDKEGQIYVNRGRIVDAVVEDYDSVERAYLHMLTWIDGTFYVIFQDVHLDSQLVSDNQALFKEGAKIIDQWRRAIGELPSLHTCLIAVKDENNSALSYPERSMLAHFHESRSILQAIDVSDFDDFDGLKIIKSLLEKGLLIKTDMHRTEKNSQHLALHHALETDKRDAKTKYSHIFSIFQRNKRSNADNHGSMNDKTDERAESLLTQHGRIKNNVQLTKAELLLIRQKLGK
ncbi:response regulator [candidate division KSB1 bacterium]|nr:response regulator [candidate division KSB1 bacterium]RQW00213.1 MAG: response regulator [candidate division KSB1 bacterium]